MVERASNLFQRILAIASLNTFLYMVYCAYYWVLAFYDLRPSITKKKTSSRIGHIRLASIFTSQLFSISALL